MFGGRYYQLIYVIEKYFIEVYLCKRSSVEIKSREKRDMMCWVTKLRLQRIALRDAKGLYGSFLIQRQRKLEEIPSVSIEFQLSDWTKSLISDYKNIAEKLINKRKHIVMLYAEIRRYYAKFNEATNDFNNKESSIQSSISKIEIEIAKIEEEINEISKVLSDFYEGKSLPSGLTPRKLNNNKAIFEQKLSERYAEKKSVSDISSIQTEYSKFIKEYKDKVYELESDFSKQIDLLDKRIRKIEIKYNEQINYYWKKLLEYIQKKRNVHINEFVICLKDIASFCGMELIVKQELFKDEREFINTTINQAMNIQYEI